MTKVYVVIEDYYDEYQEIVGVFSTRERADQFLLKSRTDYKIEEYILDDVVPFAYCSFSMYFDGTTTTYNKYISPRTKKEKERLTKQKHNTPKLYQHTNKQPYLLISVYRSDATEGLDIANNVFIDWCRSEENGKRVEEMMEQQKKYMNDQAEYIRKREARDRRIREQGGDPDKDLFIWDENGERREFLFSGTTSLVFGEDKS